MPKILFQLYIDKELLDYVIEKAKETEESRASVVRKMIEEYKEREEAKTVKSN